MDAGRADDAGPGDAGHDPDAGGWDAGHAPDAGGWDAGHAPDAHLPADAGVDAGLDGGTDAGCSPDGGLVISPHTIDRSELDGSQTHAASARGLLFNWRRGRHYMSDGTSWLTGGGGRSFSYALITKVERVGSSIRYHMTQFRLSRVDYDSGEHFADFALESVSDVVLVAQEGGTVATMEGELRITDDEPWTDCATSLFYRFHHLSAPVGSMVPFVATLTLEAPASFTETVFDAPFDYRWDAVIDFGAAAP